MTSISRPEGLPAMKVLPVPCLGASLIGGEEGRAVEAAAFPDDGTRGGQGPRRRMPETSRVPRPVRRQSSILAADGLRRQILGQGMGGAVEAVSIGQPPRVLAPGHPVNLGQSVRGLLSIRGHGHGSPWRGNRLPIVCLSEKTIFRIGMVETSI